VSTGKAPQDGAFPADVRDVVSFLAKSEFFRYVPLNSYPVHLEMLKS